jgi:hypothetical protein
MESIEYATQRIPRHADAGVGHREPEAPARFG